MTLDDKRLLHLTSLQLNRLTAAEILRVFNVQRDNPLPLDRVLAEDDLREVGLQE